MTHHRSNWHHYYPVDLPRLAYHLEQHAIDIAPTRLTWQRLAQCIANLEGEQGRESFHRIAAVWPDYSRHDSELCYNRALQQRGSNTLGIAYLAKTCRRHGINLMAPRYRKAGKPIIIDNNQQQQPKQETTTMQTIKPIKDDLMESTFPNGRDFAGRCPLTDLLLHIFPREQVIRAINDYHVGFLSFAGEKRDRSILYWQVDERGIIHNAKCIYYKAGGHRDKKIPPHLYWSRKPQCLFGLHLYNGENRRKRIAIVESEKSAIVMSIVKPQYLWMATGSLNNFNEYFLQPLKGATITAFPDVDYLRDEYSGKSVSFTLWKRTAQELNKMGWNIKVSTALEEKATTSQRLDKIDIADIAIEKAKDRYFNSLLRK